MDTDQDRAATVQPNKPEVNLTINDLIALKGIVEIASQRGVFKPSEMVLVGQTYNNLTAFLDSVKQQQEKTTS